MTREELLKIENAVHAIITFEGLTSSEIFNFVSTIEDELGVDIYIRFSDQIEIIGLAVFKDGLIIYNIDGRELHLRGNWVLSREEYLSMKWEKISALMKVKIMDQITSTTSYCEFFDRYVELDKDFIKELNSNFSILDLASMLVVKTIYN